MTLARRGFLFGLGSALAAPAIIRTPGLLMPVRAVPVMVPRVVYEGWDWKVVYINWEGTCLGRAPDGRLTPLTLHA